jgi:hypothetical protein
MFFDYKEILSDNFCLFKSYGFYNNPYNLVAKLQSEMPTENNDFILGLKKALEKAK